MMRHSGARFDRSVIGPPVAGQRRTPAGDTDGRAASRPQGAGVAATRIDRRALRQCRPAQDPGATGADHAWPPRRAPRRNAPLLRDRVARAPVAARDEQPRHSAPQAPLPAAILSRGASPAP